jgi:hypothetical protein
MRRVGLLAAVVAVGVLGCRQIPELSSDSMFMGDFRSTGEVALSGRIPLVSTNPGGASFNRERVVGVQVDVSKRNDGTWGGRINGAPVSINEAGTRITGSGVDINIKRNENEWVIGGYWINESIRIVLNDQEIRAQTPGRSFALKKIADGLYGEEGQLRFLGEAALPDPPMPQLAVALLATI